MKQPHKLILGQSFASLFASLFPSSYASIVIVFGTLVCVCLHLVVPKDFGIGFDSGFAAFSAAFLAIESVSKRIFAVGNLRSGVRSSLFWVAFKFLAPFGVLFLGVRCGGDVFGVFCGLVFGLFAVAGVLWLYGHK